MNKKTCKICLLEKDIINFHKNSASKSGYEIRCKQCKKLGLTLYNTRDSDYPKKNKNPTWEQQFNVRQATKQDYKVMYELMEKIGFNPENVHQDFCKKYNLEPRLRSPKNENLYLPNLEINPKSYGMRYSKNKKIV